MSEPEAKTPSNNELAIQRTEFAQNRTDLAEERTELSRERTRAAQERTLMAWIRTSLSMISFGFGIDRFFNYLEETKTERDINSLTEERILGLSLMFLGLFALIAALISHWFTLKNIQKKDFKYIPNWSLGFMVGTILLFIGLAAFIPLVTDNFNLTEIFTLDSQVIKNLIALTIFTIMLTMGAKIPLPELVSLKNHPKFLAKSLLSVLVLFPLIVFSILLVFPTNKATAIALILLAASPGPPLLTKRAMMAGGRENFSASLQVVLSLLAVIFTPLTLFIFAQLIPDNQGTIHLLGGIDQSLDTRSTLATATVARNVGLALFIAIVNGATIAIPPMAAYLILGVVLSLPYNVWIKKQIAAQAT